MQKERAAISRAKQKERAAIKKRDRKWNDKDQHTIKRERIRQVKKDARKHKGTIIPPSFLQDFRQIWLHLFNYRIHWTRFGVSAIARAGVLRSGYYSLIYPKLTNVRYWMAHWGDWSLKQFNFRVIGEISKIKDLQAIFGEELLRPRECDDLEPYNPDPSMGEVVGFMCFLDPSNFTLSYDPERQFLKITFSYKTYWWKNEEGRARLEPYNCPDHMDTPNFPAKGLRVRVFWQRYEEWYPAMVKRWSTANNSWVLQYDDWRDAVYEDVPVSQWQFLTCDLHDNKR